MIGEYLLCGAQWEADASVSDITKYVWPKNAEFQWEPVQSDGSISWRTPLSGRQNAQHLGPRATLGRRSVSRHLRLVDAHRQ